MVCIHKLKSIGNRILWINMVSGRYGLGSIVLRVNRAWGRYLKYTARGQQRMGLGLYRGYGSG
eukprot:924553-Amorphochlora_amoeboformis.AAC.1